MNITIRLATLFLKMKMFKPTVTIELEAFRNLERDQSFYNSLWSEVRELLKYVKVERVKLNDASYKRELVINMENEGEIVSIIEKLYHSTRSYEKINW